jgi:branched-chain amino acid transport system ATP-binding protein
MPPDAENSRIAVRNLHAYYNESHVLHGIDIDVKGGELVSLLGRNGAGKTSLLRSIVGTLITRKGEISIDGTRVETWPSFRIARLGLGYVPEERGIYSGLSVHENLTLPPVLKPGGLSMDEIYRLFPNLKERGATQGTKLSGGEQQMLAIARILRTGADLILLDEPTEGLAPAIVDQIGAALNVLKSRGFTILLVEQNIAFAVEFADRHYVLDEGRVVDQFVRAEAEDRIDQLVQYLTV